MERTIVENKSRGNDIEYGYYVDKVFIRHREDGPAVIREDGTEEWFFDGKKHRVGGPAVYNKKTGEEKWIVHGNLHREGGEPASIGVAGEKRWYINGQLHREDGPAIISHGKESYFIGAVGVPEKVVMNPADQTIQEITDEENLEVRRIRIERFGWERYLQEAGAEVIDEGMNVIESTKECLFVIKDMTIFVGACPSTARVYTMEVPNDTKTCEEARGYLSNKDPKRCIGAS